MKKILLLPLLILLGSLLSCGDSGNIIQTKLPDQPQAEKVYSEVLPAQPQSESAEHKSSPAPQSQLTAEDLALMKASSSPMEDEPFVSFEKIAKGTYPLIPKPFLSSYIYHLPVKEAFTPTIEADDYEPFYFHAYRQSGDLLLFTILHTNEYCCIMTYGITIDKSTNTILDTSLLGVSGGDGGWYRTDTGFWSNDSTLVVAKVDVESEELTNDISIMIKDSVQQQFTYTRQGMWSKLVIDSVRLVDTLNYSSPAH